MAGGPIEDAKKKRKAQLSRTEQALRAMGEGMDSPGPAKRPAPSQAAPAKVEEKAGAGRDNSAANAKALSDQVRARIDAMLKNQAKAEKEGNTGTANRLAAMLEKERAKLKGLTE